MQLGDKNCHDNKFQMINILIFVCIESFFCFCRYSLNDILSILDDDIDNIQSADIIMIPPSDELLSAEDSDDEDQPTNIDHLSGRQLMSEAEANFVDLNGDYMSLSATKQNASSENEGQIVLDTESAISHDQTNLIQMTICL